MKIPPRPNYDKYNVSPEALAWLWHERGVAEVAVKALRDIECACVYFTSVGKEPVKGECKRCEALRQIEESGWD